MSIHCSPCGTNTPCFMLYSACHFLQGGQQVTINDMHEQSSPLPTIQTTCLASLDYVKTKNSLHFKEQLKPAIATFGANKPQRRDLVSSARKLPFVCLMDEAGGAPNAHFPGRPGTGASSSSSCMWLYSTLNFSSFVLPSALTGNSKIAHLVCTSPSVRSCKIVFMAWCLMSARCTTASSNSD